VWIVVGCAVALLLGKAIHLAAIREERHDPVAHHTLTRA
jgi:hypothetical protein